MDHFIYVLLLTHNRERSLICLSSSSICRLSRIIFHGRLQFFTGDFSFNKIMDAIVWGESEKVSNAYNFC